MPYLAPQPRLLGDLGRGPLRATTHLVVVAVVRVCRHEVVPWVVGPGEHARA